MHFRKERGWSGRTYYVQMTTQEIEAQRKLGMVIGVPIVMIVLTVLMVLAAGLLK